MSNFSERLSGLRKAMGWSRKRAISELNLPYQTYPNYELGKREPDIATIAKLADKFNTTTDYLTGKSNDPRTLDEIIKGMGGLKSSSHSLEVDLAKDPVVLAYNGIPVSDEDKEIIEAVLERHTKKKI